MQIHEALRRLNIVDARTFSELSPAGQQIRKKYEKIKEAFTTSRIDIQDGLHDEEEIKPFYGKWIKELATSLMDEVFLHYPPNRFYPFTEYVQVGQYYFRVREKELVSAPLEKPKYALFPKPIPNFDKAQPASYVAWYDHGLEAVTNSIQALIKDGHVRERRLLEVPYP